MSAMASRHEHLRLRGDVSVLCDGSWKQRYVVLENGGIDVCLNCLADDYIPPTRCGIRF